jgi:hypothetical protein
MDIMKKGIVIIGLILGAACMFVAGGIQAGTTVPDVIKFNTPEYAKHTKGIVEFTHKKHASDYGAACGECHHDDKGKPLDLKEGDNVQRCIECHKETGKKPKEEKLKKKEKIMKYHKEALHANCKDCHKQFNKKKGLKANDPGALPTTCKNCHPKKEK